MERAVVVGVSSQPSPLARWLLVLAVGIGVVAMHSVVVLGACSSHGGGHASSPAVDGQSHGAEHGGHSGPAEPSDAMAAPLGTSLDPAQGDGHGPGGCSSLGHLCLAILNALGLIVIIGLALMAALVRGRTEAMAGGTTARGARAPPVARPPNKTSLTELCVSRS